MALGDRLADCPALHPLSHAALRIADERSGGVGIWLGLPARPRLPGAAATAAAGSAPALTSIRSCERRSAYMYGRPRRPRVSQSQMAMRDVYRFATRNVASPPFSRRTPRLFFPVARCDHGCGTTNRFTVRAR